MKRKISFAIVFLFVLSLFSVFAPLASATGVQIDLDKLDPATAAQVLEAKKQADGSGLKPDVSTPDKFKEWIGVGTALGQALVATAKELGVEVNKFVETPVGKAVSYLIIWKVVGKDLWNIFGGIGAWLFITAIIGWSFRYFHMSARHVDKTNKDNKIVTYIPRYEFQKDDARGISAFAHGALFVIFTIICLIIIF